MMEPPLHPVEDLLNKLTSENPDTGIDSLEREIKVLHSFLVEKIK